jgi:hypothetical protein
MNYSRTEVALKEKGQGIRNPLYPDIFNEHKSYLNFILNI